LPKRRCVDGEEGGEEGGEESSCQEGGEEGGSEESTREESGEEGSSEESTREESGKEEISIHLRVLIKTRCREIDNGFFVYETFVDVDCLIVCGENPVV
jgi:hypothetical protein